jgi:hypothetical protein
MALLLICASALHKHTTPGTGINKASIRIMRSKGGFLITHSATCHVPLESPDVPCSALR